MTKTIRWALVLGCCAGWACTCGPDPSGETARFDAAGGQHTYPNGVTITVPSGALNAPTDIAIRNLTPEEMDELLRLRAITSTSVLFALDAQPDGLAFAKPVTVSVPTDRLTPEMLPLITEFHLDEAVASVARLSYVTDPENKTLRLSLDHFTGFAGEIERELLKKCAQSQEADPCRCWQAKVRQEDYDASCSDRMCQYTYSEFEIEYPLCPGTAPEHGIFEEASDGCEPKFTVNPAERYIDKGAQTSVTARVQLGCAKRFPDQLVQFAASGPGSVAPDEASTDTDGAALATVTAAHEEGVINVDAEVFFTWRKKRLVVNGEVLALVEIGRRMDARTEIHVIEKPRILLFADPEVIDTEEMSTIDATVIQGENPVPGQLVRFIVQGPATVLPSSGNTDSNGGVTVLLFAENTTGNAVVIATSDVQVRLTTGDDVTIPVDATIAILIRDEPDLDGTVWRFVRTSNIVFSYEPIGCSDPPSNPACTCVGTDPTIDHEEHVSERVSGKLSVSRGNRDQYVATITDVNGTLTVGRPAAEYALTCPLGGGPGVIQCDCLDPGFTKTYGHGVDAVDETRSLTWANPTELQINADFTPNLWIDFFSPYDEHIERRTWRSKASDCACLEWNGERSYTTHPGWSFWNWSVEEVILRNHQWTETYMRGGSVTDTYSFECIANCDL